MSTCDTIQSIPLRRQAAMRGIGVSGHSRAEQQLIAYVLSYLTSFNSISSLL